MTGLEVLTLKLASQCCYTCGSKGPWHVIHSTEPTAYYGPN